MTLSSKVKTVEDDILEVLENNGFSSKDLGSVFYMECIKFAVDMLVLCSSNIEFEGYLVQFQSEYSNFYFSIVNQINQKIQLGRYFIELEDKINIQMFHREIKKSFSCNKRFSGDENNYMKLIYNFALFILKKEKGKSDGRYSHVLVRPVN